MEAFSALLALCEGNPPANNQNDGDLRRLWTHYDVIVMSLDPLLNKQLGFLGSETPRQSYDFTLMWWILWNAARITLYLIVMVEERQSAHAREESKSNSPKSKRYQSIKCSFIWLGWLQVRTRIYKNKVKIKTMNELLSLLRFYILANAGDLCISCCFVIRTGKIARGFNWSFTASGPFPEESQMFACISHRPQARGNGVKTPTLDGNQWQ